MVAVRDPSSLLLSLVCITSLFSRSDAQNSTADFASGIISQNCSSVTWSDMMSMSEGIPLRLDIELLDYLCENPTCYATDVMCQVGNCLNCVPITVDYSTRIFFSVEYVEGNGSEALEGNFTCSVGPQNTTNLGHYNASCVATNNLIVVGDVYNLVMTVMSPDNTTVLVTIKNYICFQAGNPVPEYTWAEFADPPVGIYHKNMLRLWLNDVMHNVICLNSSQAWAKPIPFSVVVTRTSGEAATLQIPPEPDSYSEDGYYLAPITPIYIGDYIATITFGGVQISNSPLHFTVGEKFGIATRNASASTALVPPGLLSYLLVVASGVVTLSSL